MSVTPYSSDGSVLPDDSSLMIMPVAFVLFYGARLGGTLVPLGLCSQYVDELNWTRPRDRPLDYDPNKDAQTYVEGTSATPSAGTGRPQGQSRPYIVIALAAPISPFTIVRPLQIGRKRVTTPRPLFFGSSFK